VPNDNCDGCVCDETSGYTGDRCGTRFTRVTLDGVAIPAALAKDDPAAFNAHFAADVASSLNISAQRVRVESVGQSAAVSDGLSVVFKLVAEPEPLYEGSVFNHRPNTPEAIVDPLFGMPGDDTEGDQDLVLQTVTGTADDDLGRLASQLQKLLSNSSSSLFAGTVTSTLAYGSASVRVSDPRAAVPANGGSSSGVKVSAIVPAVVVGGVALIALAAFVVARKRRAGQAKQVPTEESDRKEVELTSPPAASPVASDSAMEIMASQADLSAAQA